MQGPYTLSEPEAKLREFALFLVDIDDLKTPITTEAGNVCQLRKPGETSWTNTDEVLAHIGDGHYIIALTATELSEVGFFSLRYPEGNAVEFQDTGKVIASSADISLDEINQKIDRIGARLKHIEFLVKKQDKLDKGDPFLDPS